MVTVWWPAGFALAPDPGFAVVQPTSATALTAATARAVILRLRAVEENTRCAVNFNLLFELPHDAAAGVPARRCALPNVHSNRSQCKRFTKALTLRYTF